MWRSSESDSETYVKPRSTKPADGKSISWLRQLARSGEDDSLSAMGVSFLAQQKVRVMFTDERLMLETLLSLNV